jgi:hypothetical protein
MANFKVIRQRVETITKQDTVMVEAFTAEKASGSLAQLDACAEEAC